MICCTACNKQNLSDFNQTGNFFNCIMLFIIQRIYKPFYSNRLFNYFFYLGNYEHYMIKEIIEEPVAIERLINSLNNEQHDTVEKISSLIKIRKVLFVACGTAYHASLLGTSFLRFAGINADAVIASEYQNYMADKNTCVIAVSQSGETMDVIKALH